MVDANHRRGYAGAEFIECRRLMTCPSRAGLESTQQQSVSAASAIFAVCAVPCPAIAAEQRSPRGLDHV